jgi:hypothetical protein
MLKEEYIIIISFVSLAVDISELWITSIAKL